MLTNGKDHRSDFDFEVCRLRNWMSKFDNWSVCLLDEILVVEVGPIRRHPGLTNQKTVYVYQ